MRNCFLVVLSLSLLLCVGGCNKKKIATNPNCLDSPGPLPADGCPKWSGAECWVNVEWMESQEKDPNHLAITLGKSNQIHYCSNVQDDGHKFVITSIDERSCSNINNPPSSPVGTGFPAGFSHVPAHEQLTGPVNQHLAKEACYKSTLTRDDHSVIDPHIIIKPY